MTAFSRVSIRLKRLGGGHSGNSSENSVLLLRLEIAAPLFGVAHRDSARCAAAGLQGDLGDLVAERIDAVLKPARDLRGVPSDDPHGALPFNGEQCTRIVFSVST